MGFRRSEAIARVHMAYSKYKQYTLNLRYTSIQIIFRTDFPAALICVRHSLFVR